MSFNQPYAFPNKPENSSYDHNQPGENVNSKQSDLSNVPGAAQPSRKQSRSSSGSTQRTSSSHAGLRGQQAFVVNPKKRALEHKQQTGGSLDSVTLSNTVLEPSALAYQITSELNERLDKDIDSLLSSFSDIIKCSKVQDKDKFCVQQEKYQIECRTANLVRSCESILTLIAEMKQSLLLNDTTMFAPQPLKHSDPGAYVTPSAEPQNPSTETGTENSKKEADLEVVIENDFCKSLTNLHPVGRSKLTNLASLYPISKLT